MVKRLFLLMLVWSCLFCARVNASEIRIKVVEGAKRYLVGACDFLNNCWKVKEVRIESVSFPPNTIFRLEVGDKKGFIRYRIFVFGIGKKVIKECKIYVLDGIETGNECLGDTSNLISRRNSHGMERVFCLQH